MNNEKQNGKAPKVQECDEETMQMLFVKICEKIHEEKEMKRRHLSFFILLSPLLVILLLHIFMPEHKPYKPCSDSRGAAVGSKPIVYFYPERQADVTVKLELNGKLMYTYPQYADGWNVTASPDGALVNHADGREYSYLFWEGEIGNRFDFIKGFVVKGSDTVVFLQEKLAHLGLTPREYNEFIVYWLPQMQDNAYNLIAFQGAAYTDNAKLTITPEPDSILRVFMAFRPLKNSIEIPPQELKTFERKGFAVVEWGGTRVP